MVGVFGYSDEDGTEAADLPDKIDPTEVLARVERITSLVEVVSADRAARRIGTEVEVLVERQELSEAAAEYPDLADRATSETDRALELRTRDRQRKLISKIDSAIRRIEDGSYGYCEDTGEPIGLARLDARPIATLSLEAQERHEKRERVHRDD